MVVIKLCILTLLNSRHYYLKLLTFQIRMDIEDVDPRYDQRWPGDTSNRPRMAYTLADDNLILHYLILTEDVGALGGNAVFERMATSRHFNPKGRTFHSLRERFLKSIKKKITN